MTTLQRTTATVFAGNFATRRIAFRMSEYRLLMRSGPVLTATLGPSLWNPIDPPSRHLQQLSLKFRAASTSGQGFAERRCQIVRIATAAKRSRFPCGLGDEPLFRRGNRLAQGRIE